MTVTISVLLLAALLFVTGWVRADLVAVCAMLSLLLFGVLTPEEALAGFSNSVVVMMAALFIVGGAVLGTGLAHRMGERILSLAGGSETKLFVLLMLATSFIGAFVSNTGTVALMMPIVVSAARSAGVSASRLLMPLAFAGSMGGMLTLIGTPPNLIVSDALERAGYEPLTFFSFTPVGLLCVAVGIVALIPLSHRFLGGKKTGGERKVRGKTVESLAEEYGLTRNLQRLKVSAKSPVAGKSLRDLRIRERYGLTVLEVRRTAMHGGLLRKVTQYVAPHVGLAAGDVLYVSGAEADAERMAREEGLVLLRAKTAELRFYDVGLAEVLLQPASTLVNRSVSEADLRTLYGVSVMGIRRRDRYLLDGLKDTRLHAGDVLLVQGTWDDLERMAAAERDWVVLGSPSQQASRVTLDFRAPLAAVIMLVMVLVMAVDAIPVEPVTAVMVAAVLMVFTGCLRNVETAYSTINWESIVLFAAMLPMSTALEKTGVSELVSGSLVELFGGYGPYALLAAVYAATSLLTFFISNTVTAVLMCPIALSAATHLSAAGGGTVSAVPFLMAVTVAASMCFASPFSTPPNALVMSAGGYKAVDYLKVGLPLQLVMGVVMVFALPLLFPF